MKSETTMNEKDCWELESWTEKECVQRKKGDRDRNE